MLHLISPESDSESGILPESALKQMTDYHLMEASLSKQTQYTLPLRDPKRTKEKQLPQICRDGIQSPLLLVL